MTRLLLLALAVALGCSGDAASDRAPEPIEPVPGSTPEPEPEREPEPESEAPTYFRAEGSPDPLACEGEDGCSFRPLPAEDGCCDRLPPGTGAVTARDYTNWLTTYRREQCGEVECPESPSYRPSERCARDGFCWEGRCRDACGGIPDESSLPVARISLREAKRRARETVTGESESASGERPRCADRPLDGVIVVGSFAHDRGCAFTGAFVGETFHQDKREAAVAFLAGYDWANASESERESVASSIGRHLLYAMRNVTGLEVTTRGNGSVRVDLETRPPSGMRRRREPPPTTAHHFVIDARGRLR